MIYNELLVGTTDIMTPYEPDWSNAVYHLYVIRSKKRDILQKILLDNGVNTGLHYPVPLHLQKAYANAGYSKGEFPIAEKAAEEILSLPMFPGITLEQQRYVAEQISRT
jgi:dTDP-4-amino-4,6-dideoxygalactose transaminase